MAKKIPSTNKRKRTLMKKPALRNSRKNSKDLFERIQRCVDEKIRPYIQMDGGEIELVKLTEDNTLQVRLHGACHGCAAASMTLQFGVQNAIDEEFPEESIKLELLED